MKKFWDDSDTRARRAAAAFHDERLNGHVNMVDQPMPYDPQDTVLSLIVDVKKMQVIRCALNRQQAKNLVTKIMESL